MNSSRESSGLVLNISAVERETGLSKDVLRMWERRYGFPKPGARRQRRAPVHDRATIAKLRAIKRLMDVGHASGQDHGAVARRAQRAGGSPRSAARATSSRRRSSATFCRCCSRTTRPALQHALANLLMKQGLQKFVLETLTPLNRAVGDAWMRGELQVFEEHLYTEQLQVALRTAINAFPRQLGMPRVLLTTFPSEQHGVGLLMVEALLVPEGVQCISLGTQTPLEDIRRAALAHKVHIVALSFSGAFPLRQATDGLASLRRQLPPQVTIWAGGEMTRRVRKTMPGVVLIPDLAFGGERAAQLARALGPARRPATESPHARVPLTEPRAQRRRIAGFRRPAMLYPELFQTIRIGPLDARVRRALARVRRREADRRSGADRSR